MDAKISPSKVSGAVDIPPSKSIAHRAIICACLAEGRSVISNIDYSADIIATINGMKALGAKITEAQGNNGRHTLLIDGIGDFNGFNGDAIFCNESGSTLRFLIPIFALLGRDIIFSGAPSLIKRPQTVYEEIFNITREAEQIQVRGKLSSGNFEIRGDISSQFITGLLFTLPLLDGDSAIKIIPPFESASYVALTIDILNRFGIDIERGCDDTFHISGGQRYKVADYSVEGDYSQLGFYATLGGINSATTCHGLNTASLQGDKAIINIVKSFGVQVNEIDDGYTFAPPANCLLHGALHGARVDLSDCPDLGPILMVLAMFSDGETMIYNAERLRIKESDRIASMEAELKKLGVDIKSEADKIIIHGKRAQEYTIKEGVAVYGHNDHRVVMSLAIAATCLNAPIQIKGAEAVNKSYPRFFDDLEKLGVGTSFC